MNEALKINMYFEEKQIDFICWHNENDIDWQVLKSMNKLTKNIISLIISLSILGLAVANLIALIKIYEITS